MTLPSYASEAYTRAAQEAVEPRELEARLLMKAAGAASGLAPHHFKSSDAGRWTAPVVTTRGRDRRN